MDFKVSIIIPCYNAMPYLEETLNSVFSQSYPLLEVILIDDGSTDGSFEYAISVKDERLLVKKNTTKGACAARNYGLSLAKGQYIQFLDADDVLSPDKIAGQVALLKEFPNHIAVCDTANFFDAIAEGKVEHSEYLYSNNDPKAFLLNLYGANGKSFGMVQTSAWLTPKKLIDDAGYWDTSLSKDQDGEFFCRVLMKSKGVCFSPKGVNYYRKHIGGTNIASGKERKHIESQYKALLSKVDQLAEVKGSSSYNVAFAMQFKHIAIDAWPLYKDISEKALMECEKLGGSKYNPVLGGKMIELIKTFFGWKIANSFRFWIHQIKSKQ